MAPLPSDLHLCTIVQIARARRSTQASLLTRCHEGGTSLPVSGQQVPDAEYRPRRVVVARSFLPSLYPALQRLCDSALFSIVIWPPLAHGLIRSSVGPHACRPGSSLSTGRPQ